MKIFEVFKDKGFGFFATGVVAVFSLITAIVCASTPFAQQESLGVIIAFLLVAFIITVLLLVVPTIMPLFVKSDNAWYKTTMKALNKMSPWFLLGFSLLALLPLVSIVYLYISANATSKSFQDIMDMITEKGIVLNMVFILITVILSTVTVFLPFFKKPIKPIAKINEQGEMTNGE